jgi:hypothetical protein
MDTPLTKIRMSGFLFHKLNANGFLHWGYNYWDQMDTENLVDTFKHGDAKAWPSIPYGDPFVVYPGPDGPIDSIRWEVFSEGLQDIAIMQSAGVKRDDPMLSELKDYGHFPKNEEWIENAMNMILNKSQAKETVQAKP